MSSGGVGRVKSWNMCSKSLESFSMNLFETFLFATSMEPSFDKWVGIKDSSGLTFIVQIVHLAEELEITDRNGCSSNVFGTSNLEWSIHYCEKFWKFFFLLFGNSLFEFCVTFECDWDERHHHCWPETGSWEIKACVNHSSLFEGFWVKLVQRWEFLGEISKNSGAFIEWFIIDQEER